MKILEHLMNDQSRLMDELVFEHRNKEYGAYYLRRSYDVTVTRSFLITLSMFLILAAFRFLPENEPQTTGSKQIQDHDTIIFINDILPDEPKKPKEQGGAANTNVVPLVVTTPVEPNDSLPQFNDTTALASTTTGSGTNPVTSKGNGTASDTSAKEGEGTGPKVEPYAEKMPEFPGGYAALMRFIQDNMDYPREAAGAGVSGRVAVKFYVATDGTVKNIHIVGASPGFGLDDEAIRVVEKMPKWNPGVQNGRKVNVWMVLPVKFELH